VTATRSVPSCLRVVSLLGYRKLSTLHAAFEVYNIAIEEANKLIESFKRSATPARLQSAQNELKWLQLTKKRHEQPLSDACAEYTKLTKEKEALDKQKAEARRKLEKYSTILMRS
jgi:hypothetical protein